MIHRTGVMVCMVLLVLFLSSCEGTYPTRPVSAEAGESASPSPTANMPMPTNLVASAEPPAPPRGGSVPEEIQLPIQPWPISPSKQPLPDDVFREVAFYGGGGALGVNCFDHYQQPTVIWSLDNSFEASAELLLGRISAITCGWEADDSVEVTLHFPDSTSLSQQKRAQPDFGGYRVDFEYQTKLTDPPGTYSAVFRGESGEVSVSKEIIAPLYPRLYLSQQEDLSTDDVLYVYGFEPYEHVGIFAYEGASEGSLVAWQTLQVNDLGQLILCPEPAEGLEIMGYVAVGNVSGEAQGYRNDPFSPYGFSTMFDYPGSQLSYYVVSNTGDDMLHVRERPAVSATIISEVPSGTRMKARGRPRNDDSQEWMPVSLDDGIEGWVEASAVQRLATFNPTVAASAYPPTGKLEFTAYGEVACGGVAPIPGCVYFLEKWIGAEGPIIPGEPIKILLMNPRSGTTPETDSCWGVQIENAAYDWSEVPVRIRARGEPCDLDPSYLFCVCDPEDYVRCESSP